MASGLLLVAACRQDSSIPTQPPPLLVPARIAVVAGDAQHADPQDDLPDPVRFQVFDSAGRTIPGVRVQFAVPLGGGSVPFARSVTDSAGVVETLWTMGPLGGVQTLEARINGALMATATATTCDPNECYPPERLSSTLSDATLLDLTTYEASGQTVHPDVVRGHGAATGFWLAITPYPSGNSSFENPSIYRSTDAHSWMAPTGVVNPIALPASGGYLSDPAIVANGDQQLWLYYRSVVGQQNIINLIRSRNGVQWDSPVTVLTVPSHQVVSPTVVRGAPQAPWQMWAVNAGPQGCSAPVTTVERRTSSDGVNWGTPFTVRLEQPGQAIWHIDVQWIPARSEYWALYNTYPIGTSCATDALYIARSADGVHWTVYPSPIARAGMIDAFKHLIYRSTFMADPRANRVTLWISGAAYEINVGYNWRTASVAIAVNDLFAIAASPAGGLQGPPFRRDLPPPEPDVGP